MAMFDDNNQEFLSLQLFMKATPSTEGENRIIYVEASDESLDAQSEIVLQKSLSDSLEYYLARGNLDLDHISVIGPQSGIKDYLTFEVGKPLEVKFHGDKTLVKGIIYKGEGIAAEKANMFWSSLVDIKPPANWSASVGGSIQGSEIIIDPLTKSRQRKISKVRWTNIGFSKQPVNQKISPVTTIPFGAFAKSFMAEGFYKTIEQGYGTDSATLTGGAALRKQSLAGYEDYREKVSNLLLSKQILAKNLLTESIARFDVSDDEAADFYHQFLTELSRGN